MTINDRIECVTGQMNETQAQFKSIEAQITQLQQQREQLILIYHRQQGALETLQAINAESEPAEEGA
jgi:CRISPR/Cas system-associated endoribonuclease Cas2